MSDDTQTLAHPSVEAFVDDVRARLADLTPEQRDELLDGLTADLTEQMADGADGVLDDPAAYAAELRAAAGLPEARRRVLPRLQAPTPHRVEATLDRSRERWLTRVGDHPVWEVVEAMRPAWWVARAWVAVTLVDQATGGWEPVSLLPSFGVTGLGAILLAAAVVMSVLIGLDRVWPGSGPDRPLLARLVLIGLNAAALLLPLSFDMSSPGYLSGQPDTYYNDYQQGYQAASQQKGGLWSDGRPVRNVFAYTPAGSPIEGGVQLFDQDGRPLDIAVGHARLRHDQDRWVGCGWRNGTTLQYNVFPLAERMQDYGTCSWEKGTGRRGPVAMPTPPLAAVPPVALPDGVPEPTVPERIPENVKPGEKENDRRGS